MDISPVTAKDITQLYQHWTWGLDGYREIQVYEAAAQSCWPLMSGSWDQPFPPSRPYRTANDSTELISGVAVVGSHGGVDPTPVTAHLTAGFHQEGWPLLAIDLCPTNTLRLYLGMDKADPAGLVPQWLSGDPWYEAIYRGSMGLDFLPFGEAGPAIDSFVASLAERPGWLEKDISRLDISKDFRVISNCPRQPYSLFEQGIRIAQTILVVLEPDPLSLVAIPSLLSDLARLGVSENQVLFVLDGYLSSRQLDRDVRNTLHASRLRSRLSPVVIHQDEFIREALATQKTLFDYCPHSQAAHDFNLLQVWLKARMNPVQQSVSLGTQSA
ncbi:MAG TPA: cellulose biosynthesis protein BcsQ [Chromatiaceae bacterium]|nr:cellulose biosynthesis protein BcsQ [Chromatiaceae bacterium]